jgi:hypothetical protein
MKIRVFEIKTEKETFTTHSTDHAERAVSRDDLISITRTEMTKEDYFKIPTTPESHDFFNSLK